MPPCAPENVSSQAYGFHGGRAWYSGCAFEPETFSKSRLRIVRVVLCLLLPPRILPIGMALAVLLERVQLEKPARPAGDVHERAVCAVDLEDRDVRFGQVVKVERGLWWASFQISRPY